MKFFILFLLAISQILISEENHFDKFIDEIKPHFKEIQIYEMRIAQKNREKYEIQEKIEMTQLPYYVKTLTKEESNVILELANLEDVGMVSGGPIYILSFIFKMHNGEFCFDVKTIATENTIYFLMFDRNKDGHYFRLKDNELVKRIHQLLKPPEKNKD